MSNKTESKLVKTHSDSYFLRMQQNSRMSYELFDKNPKYDDVNVVVLQVLTTDSDWIVVEVIDEKDYYSS